MTGMHIVLAVLLLAQAGDVGVVSFANSGAPAAQTDFLRGLALLHDFEYARAAESFRKAEQIDPSFAMAYWGEAMTYNHPIWFQQDLEKARGVLARMPEAKTERERDYIAALKVLYGDGTKEERDFKYADAMAALHAKYPDDVDATAFYALSLLGTCHNGRDFATYMRAAALLEEVFPTHRQHPGVLHYLIHSYDDPIHAPLGLRAARLYGKLAPDAPHALHMTSHIFIAIGMWDDVIDANKRAIAAMPKLAPCGHYAQWLQYAYLQKKNFADAKKLLETCEAAERDSKDADEMQLISVSSGGPLGRSGVPYADALDAFRGHDVAALNAAASRFTAPDEARPMYRERADVIRLQIEAMKQSLEGKHAEAIATLRKAAEAEKAMPFEFGPPFIEKPTLELLGDELMAAGRPAEAASAYKAQLSRTPGRTVTAEALQRSAK